MPLSKPTELTEEQVQLIAKALADPRRYEIVKRVSQCKDATIACEAVRECLDITAPTLSHHMKELEVAGIITPWRTGKFISYQLRRDVLELFLRRVRRDFM
jgi:ArsR family transcriptional regulator